MKSRLNPLFLLIFMAPFTLKAESQTVKIDGMTCGACVKSVKKAVCESPLGSSLSKCEVKIGSLQIEGDKIDLPGIKKAITEAGFQPK